MQVSSIPPRAPSRSLYPATSSAASMFSSYADPSAFSFPSKVLPLSRQSSIEPSFGAGFPSVPFPSLHRQVSISAFSDSFESFNFPSFDDGELMKEGGEAFDLHSRVSSFDSDVSSWASIASDDSGSAPRSPQSSLDSSHFDDLEDMSSSTSSPLSYPVQDLHSQPLFQRQAIFQMPKTEQPPLVTPTAVPRFSYSSVPVPPLPFKPPVYAFNYHEDELAPALPCSRHERREGLRGGGDGRQEPRGFFHSQNETHSTASAQSMGSSAMTTGSDISPKSLLLSLRTATASHPSSQSSQHSAQHFSPSSSSSHSSSTASLNPDEVVIGIYTRAERAAKIARYREKRAHRQWQKKILYGCRKSFADNRPRVGGRFIKMKPAEEEDTKTRRM